MKTRVTLRFLDEARRFALRYACDDCAHFAGVPDDSVCAHGYPIGERRDRALRPDDDELSFCKEFEGA